MHRPLYVIHSLFIEGSHMTKITASVETIGSILGYLYQTGVNVIKLFWRKFTYSFCKLDLFIPMQQILPML
jgi:hypothetical protein